MVGDLIAKIGDNNRGYVETMGQHGLCLIDDNGQHLADFCAHNSLVIGGLIFQYKRVYKISSVSPDAKTVIKLTTSASTAFSGHPYVMLEAIEEQMLDPTTT